MMINTLLLPELREMLAENNVSELSDFCSTLYPARVAEFMEGLDTEETWQILQFAEVETRAEIFSYLSYEKQFEILSDHDLAAVAPIVAHLSPDDRVDILRDIDQNRLKEILQAIPAEDRRDYLRLSQYPEGTAGAKMTTEFAKLGEDLTIREAVDEIGKQANEYETIYYLYIVDQDDRLRGLVSARQLLEHMKSPQMKLKEIMETDLVCVDALEDQEEVANKVARFDLLAIPVVDDQHRMLGIITHDDVIDVVRREATEDAHRSAAVEPLNMTYLRTSILSLTWKRGIWLGMLFFFALLTATTLDGFQEPFRKWAWLIPFIPLITCTGGNSGTQSAALIITALSRGHITLSDWRRVIFREWIMGLLLGSGLAVLGLVVSQIFVPGSAGVWATYIVSVTLLCVVTCGTLIGSVLPLLFERLGWDPAMMSNPFVSGIMDILGIMIYVNLAIAFLE